MAVKCMYISRVRVYGKGQLRLCYRKRHQVTKRQHHSQLRAKFLQSRNVWALEDTDKIFREFAFLWQEQIKECSQTELLPPGPRSPVREAPPQKNVCNQLSSKHTPVVSVAKVPSMGTWTRRMPRSSPLLLPSCPFYHEQSLLLRVTSHWVQS